MKKKFSIAWKSSSQTRKQRKYVANAPLHLRHKLLSANLSKDLRKKYGKRNFPLRKGDEVKVMVGKFKGKTGKVAIVKTKERKVAIEGVQTKKKDGTKINALFDASNLQIRTLEMGDKKRIKSIERKAPKTKSKGKENELPKKKQSK
jgi:large subunit ribosomal protein L24